MEAFLAEITKTMQAARAVPEQIDLPAFRADTDDAAQWITQVEAIKTEFALTDLQIMVRVGRFLFDDAKTWFSSWSPSIRDWTTFKNDFLESFPPKKVLGPLFCAAANCTSSDFNTYVSYVHKKTALLKKITC